MRSCRLGVILLVFVLASCREGADQPGSAGTGMLGIGGSSVTGLLPASNEIAGWVRDGDRLFYVAENLWEYIDGAAEQFLAYEFDSVAAQDYISTDGKGLKVEIYRHRSTLMAFGIYTQFRSADYEFYEIGKESFGDEYSLHLWKGPYFVKINIFEEDGEMAEAMKGFARSVAGKIESDDMLPALLSCFPEEGLVEKSIIYVTEGVLGRGKFPPAFIADYWIEGSEGKLYLFQTAGEDHAREIFDWYSGLIDAGTSERETLHGTYIVGAGKDQYRGRMLVFRYGGKLGIVAGFTDAPPLQEQIADRAFERLGAIGSGSSYIGK
ncbi:MAG: hypothetical protein JSV33_07445 [bacterium]|nr:MAG: hypothetical protein JSV33_07445 [bacterium]